MGGDDHCLLLEQPIYIVLPNVMRQIVHSHVDIVTFFNSVEANVSNSVQFLAKTVGRIRNFTEKAFDNVKTEFQYSFVHDLASLEELDGKKQELLQRKATFLAKYEGKQHPVRV